MAAAAAAAATNKQSTEGKFVGVEALLAKQKQQLALFESYEKSAEYQKTHNTHYVCSSLRRCSNTHFSQG